ncbi:MAG: hypothetical protein J6T81_06215 [Bacteroidales bacterium]|nr:hypothetical protein [Bacteroidales bacterium]
MPETTKSPTAKPFTVRIYQEDIDRFERLASEMDVQTNGGAFRNLMDFYENPPKNIIKDNPVLMQRNAELEADIEARANEITELRAKLDAANNTINSNNEAGTQLQLRIEELETENRRLKAGEQHSPYYVGGELPPVPMYFLNKMAKLQSAKDKKARTPFWILANNFIQDLQNPLSNHLPMIVSSDELRKAQKDYEASLKKTEETKEE